MNPPEKKYDVIVVGELNVDLILNKVASFPELGKEIFARQMTLTLGSSAAIFASNLSSLGARVAFIGKIGKDVFGDLVLQSLEGKKVDTHMIIRSNTVETGATIGFNYGNDRAAITYPGAMEAFTFTDIPLVEFQNARHLHFSAYFFQPGLQKNVADLFREAKKAGLTTSFDIQCDPADKWEIDLTPILPYVDIFLPNETELLHITKKQTVEEALNDLKDRVNMLVVKLGHKGSVSVHKGKTINKPAYLYDSVVDTIGAGDSFGAGFIYQFLQGAPLEVCQSFGNLTGAVSTTAAGGTTAFTDAKNTIQHAREKFGYTEANLK